MVVVVGLARVPHVKGLNHHHHSHLIAQLNKFGCGHIMAGSDCIAAHLFEHGNLMTQRILVYGCPQRTKVVVVAYALELTCLPVQPEAMFRRVRDRTYAETRADLVQ